MTWVKLDDGFSSHAKTLAAGPKSVALYVVGLCWVSRNLTDGVIPKHVLPALLAEAGVTRSAAIRLVTVGLWHDQGEQWTIHDYLDYNPSRQKVERDRERWRRYKQRPQGDSAVESREASTVESRVVPRSPVPVPVSYLHPPTTESRLNPTGREGEVLKVLLNAERQASTAARNGKAWDRTVTARLTTEHAETIHRLVNDYPDAPPDVIAGHIRGEATTLRYYQRSDP